MSIRRLASPPLCPRQSRPCRFFATAAPYLWRTVLGLAILSLPILRLEAKLGIPQYTVFEPEMIGTDEGINDISVDDLGRLVLASGNKLITFDGAAWKTYQIENSDEEPVSRFLALECSNGRLFASSDIGIHEISFSQSNRIRLSPLAWSDPAQKPRAVNLTHSLSHLNKIHFYSFNIHVSYDLETELATIKEGREANFQAIKNDAAELYTFYEGRTFRNDAASGEWVELPESTPDFLEERVVRAAESWGPHGILLATKQQTLSRFKGGQYSPWPSEIESLPSKIVSELRTLSDKHIAAAVKSEGIFILNKMGQIVQSLSAGLDYRFGHAKHLLATDRETLWASVGNSVVRIHWFDSTTRVGPLIPSALYHPRIYKWKDHIFIESEGKLDRAAFFEGGALHRFTPYGRSLPGSIDTSFPLEDSIICAGEAGLFSLRSADSFEKIDDNSEIDLIFSFKDNKDLFIAATKKHFLLYQNADGKWRQTQRIGEAPGKSYFYHFSGDGSIWIEHGVGAVSRLYLEDGAVRSRTYNTEDGLGKNWINVFSIRGKTYFGNMDSGLPGVWNPESQRIEKEYDFLTDLAIEVWHYTRPFSDWEGNLWMLTANGEQNVYAIGNQSNERRIIRNIADTIGEEFLSYGAIFSRDNIWLMGDDEIFLCSAQQPVEKQEPTPLSIIRITDAATGLPLFDAGKQAAEEALKIPYTQNTISVQLVSQAVSSKKYPLRQYRVKGIYADWQKLPNGADEIILADLPEGSYLIEARASFDGVNFSQPDQLAFAVQPPFFRSITAYALYTASVLGVFFATVVFLRIRAERKNIALSRIVAERTAEVQNANTQLNLANAELKELYQKAKAADQAKSSFLAVISHEMRTPLNSIIAPAEILEIVNTDEEQLEFIRLIKDNGKRLLAFVDDVLLFTSNDANAVKLEHEDIYIRGFLEDLLTAANFRAVKKGLTIRLSEETKLSPEMTWRTVPKSIHQILSNLIDNAIKYTESGTITLAAKVEENDRPTLAISVSDTGIGIPSEKLEEVFDPFFQVESSISRSWEGVGLGLSICKQLAKQINASFEVASELDKGSCFTLRIPAPTPSSPQTRLR